MTEILHDTWPNLYRPPHNFKPPSEYEKDSGSTVDGNITDSPKRSNRRGTS